MAWEAVVAVYAAGVSTVVAAQQVVRELPSVRVRAMRGASLIRHGQPSEAILIVDVVNAGRRRVVIDQVAFASSDHFLSIPSIWVGEWPFMLGEGELKSLRHPENGTIPDDAIFLARDTVGRWWPRHRRPMIWLRRRKAKGRTN